MPCAALRLRMSALLASHAPFRCAIPSSRSLHCVTVPGTQQDNRSVHLVSQEGDSFDIKVSVAKMSNLVKTMIDGEMNKHRRRFISYHHGMLCHF